MRPTTRSDDERDPRTDAKLRVFLVIVVLLALVAAGIWRGELAQTWTNGTTL